MKRICAVLGIAIIFALVASLAASYIKPNNNDLLPLFGLLYPYFYSAALVIVPLSYYANKWIGLIGTLVLLSATPHVLSYVQPFAKKSTSAEQELTIMSYNTMMGYGMVNDKHMFDEHSQNQLDELLISDPKPDIICAQEASEFVRTAFSKTFKGYESHQKGVTGAVIMSRYPIIDRGYVDFGSKWNNCVWADIAIAKDQKVRVYNVHFESNRLDQSTYEMLANQNYQAEKALKGFWALLKRYPASSTKRSHQAELIKDHISHSPYPVILAGDFNEPPMSHIYQTFHGDLKDAFLESGYGWGTTWRGAVPLLRIDYIFGSPELHNTGFFCQQSDLSDHYPIKASYGIDPISE